MNLIHELWPTKVMLYKHSRRKMGVVGEVACLYPLDANGERSIVLILFLKN